MLPNTPLQVDKSLIFDEPTASGIGSDSAFSGLDSGIRCSRISLKPKFSEELDMGGPGRYTKVVFVTSSIYGITKSINGNVIVTNGRK